MPVVGFSKTRIIIFGFQPRLDIRSKKQREGESRGNSAITSLFWLWWQNRRRVQPVKVQKTTGCRPGACRPGMLNKSFNKIRVMLAYTTVSLESGRGKINIEVVWIYLVISHMGSQTLLDCWIPSLEVKMHKIIGHSATIWQLESFAVSQ